VQHWIADDGSGQIVHLLDDQREGRTLLPGEWARQYDIHMLSREPGALAYQLATEHPTGRSTPAYINSIVDLWLRQAPPPALQAAILRVLANQPTIQSRGIVVDRAGRIGVAVSAHSTSMRHTLIWIRRPGCCSVTSDRSLSPVVQDTSLSIR